MPTINTYSIKAGAAALFKLRVFLELAVVKLSYVGGLTLKVIWERGNLIYIRILYTFRKTNVKEIIFIFKLWSRYTFFS